MSTFISEPGTRLGGRYRLEDRVNDSGGWSGWKAIDETLARPVAVLTFAPGFPRIREVLTAARAASRLTDARLAQVFDVEDDWDAAYVVMEWVSGDSLDDLLADGPLEPARGAEIVAEGAEALAAAHAAGLAHLCLTPQSLRWTPGGGVKVLGLGVEAALADVTADDPALADTQGLAMLLYAALTGYWPGPGMGALPPAPLADGKPCSPRQVLRRRARVHRRGDLPGAVPAGPAARPAADHPGAAGRRAVQGDPGAARAAPRARAAATAGGQLRQPGPGPPGGPGHRLPALALPGRGWLASRWPAPPASVPASAPAGQPGGDRADRAARRGGHRNRRVQPDPLQRRLRGQPRPIGRELGQPGGEGHHSAAGHGGRVRRARPPPTRATRTTTRRPAAIDGDPQTAWHTQFYLGSAAFGDLKKGTGLLLDMGKPVSLSSAQITFGPTAGANVAIEVGNNPSVTPAGLASFTRVAKQKDVGAGTQTFNNSRALPRAGTC